MRNLLFILLLLSCFITGLTSSRAEGYKIEVLIQGLENEVVYLGYHWGEKNYIIDTILLNNDGYSYFEGPDKLEGGMYIIVIKDNYFEIIINDNQEFMLETDVKDHIRQMQVNGSIENEVFFDYQKFSLENRAIEASLKERLAYNRANKDSVSFLQEQLRQNERKLQAKKMAILRDHKELLFTKILLALQNPEIPPPPVDETGKVLDTLFTFRYYKSHFFDYFDFSDQRMLRTSLLQKKLSNYFGNLVYPEYDSLVQDIDFLASKASANDAVYNYVMFYMLKMFESSHGPHMDEVFIYIAKKYFLPKAEFWNNQKFINSLEERVKDIEPSLLGKTGADLKMQKSDGEFVRLHQLEAVYKILIFWDTDCEHCKIAMPRLAELTRDLNKEEFEIFAVYTGADIEKWTTYIQDNKLEWTNVYDPDYVTAYKDYYDVFRTPEIYVLNAANKIIRRKLEVESLDLFLNDIHKGK